MPASAHPTSFQHSVSGDLPGDGVHIHFDDLLRLRTAAASLGLSPGKRVQTVQAGGYASTFRGTGMDFDEVRPYQPGDDVRHIDWRVTARSGRAHTKLFREERERPVHILVDLAPSMLFGTRGAFKSVRAVQSAALLAWAAVDNGDRVALRCAAGDALYEHAPMARERGALQALRLLERAHAGARDNSASDGQGLARLLKRHRLGSRPGALVFLISDFRTLDEDTERLLSTLFRHQDVVAVVVSDPIEHQLPSPGQYYVTDGNDRTLIDTSERKHREAWEGVDSARQASIAQALRKARAHEVLLATADNPARVLRDELHRRVLFG